MLKMLKLSSSTTLRLDCTPEFVGTQNEHVLLPVLFAHFNSPTPIEFRSFKINLDHLSRTIDIVASTSLPTSPIPHAHDIQADMDSDAELGLSLSFLHVRDPDDLMDTIVRRAFECFPFQSSNFFPFSPPSRLDQ